MSEKKVLTVSVILCGENLKKFLEIKEAKGIVNNAEVVRLVVNEYWLTLEG